MESILALHPAARGRFLAFPKIYFLRKFILSMLLRFIDSTALFSIKWTVQKLNDVDQTHLLALQDSATKNTKRFIRQYLKVA